MWHHRASDGRRGRRKGDGVDATELCYTSAGELSRLYRSRELSPVEVTDAALARIERLNPKLNTFLTVTADLAREQAKASEGEALRGELIGPLDGIPYSLKDLEPTAGIRTTFGSRWFVDHVPTEDGTVAARLKRAGAVLLGKTNTPNWLQGHVRHMIPGRRAAAARSDVQRLAGPARRWRLSSEPIARLGRGGSSDRRRSTGSSASSHRSAGCVRPGGRPIRGALARRPDDPGPSATRRSCVAMARPRTRGSALDRRAARRLCGGV